MTSPNYLLSALHVGGLFSRLQGLEARTPADGLVAAANGLMTSDTPDGRKAALAALQESIEGRAPEDLGAVGYLFLKNLDPSPGSGRRCFAAREGLSVLVPLLDARGLANLDFLIRHRVGGLSARLGLASPARKRVLLEASQIVSMELPPDRRWGAVLAIVDLLRHEEIAETRQKAFETLRVLLPGLNPGLLKALARRFLKELRYRDPCARPHRDDRDVAQALGIIARQPGFEDHEWMMDRILNRARHRKPKEREIALWTARALLPALPNDDQRKRVVSKIMGLDLLKDPDGGVRYEASKFLP